MTSVFSHKEVLQYFALIQLPQKFRSYENVPKNLDFLTALHVHQISTIPYGELGHALFQVSPRRGRHCMENNIFFLNVLRAVGFNCYYTGVRIRLRQEGVPQGPFLGLSHIGIIVTLNYGEKYHVDISFSGDGSTRPMPLNEECTILNLGTQEIRLVFSAIAQFESDIKWWIYEYRNLPDAPWYSYYCFLEVPFIQGDFEVMSYFASTLGYLPDNIVIVAFERQGDIIGGKMMLINRLVKRNMGGKTKVINECMTEEERIVALEKYFGITLTHEQREGIRGHVTELLRDRTPAS